VIGRVWREEGCGGRRDSLAFSSRACRPTHNNNPTLFFKARNGGKWDKGLEWMENQVSGREAPLRLEAGGGGIGRAGKIEGEEGGKKRREERSGGMEYWDFGKRGGHSAEVRSLKPSLIGSSKAAVGIVHEEWTRFRTGAPRVGTGRVPPQPGPGPGPIRIAETLG